jgi:integrase
MAEHLDEGRDGTRPQWSAAVHQHWRRNEEKVSFPPRQHRVVPSAPGGQGVSVFKRDQSPFYYYEFQFNGHRFFGSTKTGNRKEAELTEKQIRAKAKADLDQFKASGQGPLTIDVAAGRYWQEVGQNHAGSMTTWRDLARLIDFFGKHKRLDEIADADVAALVAWRRKQCAWGRDDAPSIAPATVNRSTTEVLAKLFTRAKRTWRYAFPREPNWRDHSLKEPEERVRELHEGEGEALAGAVRDDYAPWLEFARLTGFRHAETLIRWSEVNWSAKTIVTRGKGGRLVTTPITNAVAAVLEPLRGHDPEHVFTYVCQRSRGDRVRGERYPLTLEGTSTEWRRLRERAGVQDLRLHDLRHDVGTKLLRQTGNLKLVQQVLNHRDIKTTTRYAHVLESEKAAALEEFGRSRSPRKSPVTEGDPSSK